MPREPVKAGFASDEDPRDLVEIMDDLRRRPYVGGDVDPEHWSSRGRGAGGAEPIELTGTHMDRALVDVERDHPWPTDERAARDA